ncbi:hypothetical protein PMAYCL1PPCAC_16198, partial [Pristionchus mayeri]
MLSFLSVLLLLSGATASPCVKRYYPTFMSNSFVCVCNSTYCDTYDELPLNSGTANIYSSSSGGDRMSASTKSISSSSTPMAGKIMLNPAVTYQDIIGFGGGFTDSTGMNIASLTQPAQANLMNSMFGDSGAKYTTGRVPIASTDFSLSAYSYDDVAGDTALSNFALNNADLDYKIPYILDAINLTHGNIRLFSSPWSAPAWMKTSGKMAGPGEVLPNLKATWANYYVRFFEEYLARGVSFWATT